LIYDWFFGVHCAISKGTRARETTNSHLWGKTREVNTCNRCEFRLTLRSVSWNDESFVLSVYKKRSLPNRHFLTECRFQNAGKRLEKEIRKRPILLSPFRFSRVHLEPIQEAATENFAWRITAFLSYLEMLR